jgi:hypothetical protein
MNIRHYPKHIGFISFFILFVSFLTFFLPKEVFDSHIGIDFDVFCKSLDSIGDHIETHSLFQNEFIKNTFYLFFEKIFVSLLSSDEIPIRAPPLIAST